MAIRLMQAVWDKAPYHGEKLLTLLALADWSNDKGECWPSYDQIAARARITKRGAIGIIEAMIKDQTIELVEQGRGRGSRNKYHLKTENWQRIKGEDASPFTEQEKVKPVHLLATGKGERSDRKKVNVATGKGERSDRAYKEVTVSKPSKENLQQQQQAAAVFAAAAAEHHASRFTRTEIEAYILATKFHSTNPGGLARALWRSGEEDAAIESWQQQQNRQHTPESPEDERERIHQQLADQLADDAWGSFAASIQQMAEMVRRKPRSRWTIYEQEIVAKVEELQKEAAA